MQLCLCSDLPVKAHSFNSAKWTDPDDGDLGLIKNQRLGREFTIRQRSQVYEDNHNNVHPEIDAIAKEELGLGGGKEVPRSNTKFGVLTYGSVTKKCLTLCDPMDWSP